ncbi:hypothetical protein [Streptomyces sp. t39]|uniref:hypothetical protein n=1 Tax=Streptomyces sp. t39 TaxID=1828156 RepID=UPI0011CDE7A4|nr:hypothetical protein [Streptomyces sp. t39]TXS35060.1 hypothetical protein EAO77_37835 [Streptomyces sp. t39]
MHDDDFHSGSKPQDSLKGGMEMPHTQAPMHSEAQTNPRSASADNVGQSWDSTSLRPGHTTLNPANSQKAH